LRRIAWIICVSVCLVATGACILTSFRPGSSKDVLFVTK